MPPIFNRDLSNTDLTNHPKIKNKPIYSKAKYLHDNYGYIGDPLASP